MTNSIHNIYSAIYRAEFVDSYKTQHHEMARKDLGRMNRHITQKRRMRLQQQDSISQDSFASFEFAPPLLQLLPRCGGCVESALLLPEDLQSAESLG